MKKITIALLLITNFCFAQNNTTDHTPQNNTAKYDSIMKRANSNKVGAILGFTTGPLFIAGGAAWLALGSLETDPTQQSLSYACGSILLAGGIAEFALGGVCITKYKKQYNASQQYKPVAVLHLPQPYTTATGAGVSWRINF